MNDWDEKSFDFPLTNESVVFEVGGYIGRWATEIEARYHPRLYVFEPQLWAFEKLIHRLATPYVYNFGLGVEDGVFPMGRFETDGCSFVDVPEDKPSAFGTIVEISSFLKLNKVRNIDLMLMNIEGYEFTLIPYMIDMGIMKKVNYFMCQFHLLGKYEGAYELIRRKMGQMKRVRFEYGTTLTCWENK
jgi:FkbM family methyltransferase